MCVESNWTKRELFSLYGFVLAITVGPAAVFVGLLHWFVM